MPLKPCPFCGGSELISEPRFNPGADISWWVLCMSCPATIEAKEQDEAEKLWNTRVCQILKNVSEWWNSHDHLEAFSGAWNGIKWDDLPARIQGEITELYNSARCQH